VVAYFSHSMNLECVGLAEIFVPGKWEIFDYFSSFFGRGKGENKKGRGGGQEKRVVAVCVGRGIGRWLRAHEGGGSG
jgi:hypothetical protein